MDVEKQQVRFARSHQINGLAPVACDAHDLDITARLEQCQQPRARRLFVVNDDRAYAVHCCEAVTRNETAS